MNNKILIDSSFLYAAFNETDKNYQQAMDFMISAKITPLVPDVILPEVAFLFIRDVGYQALDLFMEKLSKARVELQNLTMSDIQRSRQIMRDYPTAKFDLVDTCIMALSERLQITQICTFDRRDFSIFRPKHCDYLELLPE